MYSDCRGLRGNRGLTRAGGAHAATGFHTGPRPGQESLASPRTLVSLPGQRTTGQGQAGRVGANVAGGLGRFGQTERRIDNQRAAIGPPSPWSAMDQKATGLRQARPLRSAQAWNGVSRGPPEGEQGTRIADLGDPAQNPDRPAVPAGRGRRPGIRGCCTKWCQKSGPGPSRSRVPPSPSPGPGWKTRGSQSRRPPGPRLSTSARFTAWRDHRARPGSVEQFQQDRSWAPGRIDDDDGAPPPPRSRPARFWVLGIIRPEITRSRVMSRISCGVI